MDTKIKKAEVYEPVTRYITTDGRKFDDPIRAEDHQYDIDTKNERKRCYEKYGIMTNMDMLVPSDQITKDFPVILSYLIPGFDLEYFDFVMLKANTIDEVSEIFSVFKDEMSETKKNSLLESFVVNGKIPCTLVFRRYCDVLMFDWMCIEDKIEKMKKAVIDAKQKLSLNI